VMVRYADTPGSSTYKGAYPVPAPLAFPSPHRLQVAL
jgi:hypothetical protein